MDSHRTGIRQPLVLAAAILAAAATAVPVAALSATAEVTASAPSAATSPAHGSRPEMATETEAGPETTEARPEEDGTQPGAGRPDVTATSGAPDPTRPEADETPSASTDQSGFDDQETAAINATQRMIAQTRDEIDRVKRYSFAGIGIGVVALIAALAAFIGNRQEEPTGGGPNS